MSTATTALTQVTNAVNGTGTFDAQTYVNSLIAAEQGPETQMQQQVASLSAQGTALGTISSQLSALQTAAFALNDFEGGLAAQTATVSDPTVASATAGAGATAGSNTLVVNSLATTSSQYTDTLADGDTSFAEGSFTVQVGGGAAATVTVDDTDNTLNGLATAINNANLGVTADVLTDANGSRLTLVSNQSGAAGQITIGSNSTGLSFTQGEPGANASYTLDGVTLASATNTIQGAIPGVTLNLLASSAETTQVTIAPDTAQMSSTIQNFVTAYNTVIESLNAQFTYGSGSSSSSSSGSGTTSSSTSSSGSGSTGTGLGPLGSDPIVMQVQQQLLSYANYSITGNGGLTNLAAIGVNMNSDGSLTIDSDTLDAAIAQDPSGVTTLFQQTGDTPGFAQNLVNNLLNMTDPTNGPLALDQNGITQSTNSLNTQITAFQAQLSNQQTALLAQYNQVAVTLQEMPTLLDQIKGQLASL